MNQKETAPIEIYYWPIRGLLQPLLYLCNYIETPYIFYKIEDRTKWFESQPELIKNGLQFPNLPYVVSSQGKISESWAILLHIAKVAKKIEMLPTIENLDLFANYAEFVKDLNITFILMAYMSQNVKTLTGAYKSSFQRHKHRLDSLNDHLGSNKWIMGDQITVIDFLLAELIERMNLMEKDLKLNLIGELDNFEKYFERFVGLEKISQFRASDNFIASPWNNPKANPAWK